MVGRVAAAVFVAMLTSTVDASGAPGWVTHRDAAYGIAISAPREWTALQSTTTHLKLFVSAPGLIEWVGIYPSPRKETTVRAFATSTLKALREQPGPNYLHFSIKTTHLPAGEAVVVSWVPKLAKDSQFRQYFLVHNGLGCRLDVLRPRSASPSDFATLDHVVRSFTFAP